MLPRENLNFQNLRNVILGILARRLTITEALITTLKSIIIFSDPPPLPGHFFFACPPPFEAVCQIFKVTNKKQSFEAIDTFVFIELVKI